MDWKEFDKKVDLEGLKNDIKETEENGGNYEDVPYGTYEVSVENCELTESKKGKPMVSIWFKIIDGKYKNSIIFMNRVVEKSVQFHIMNEFFRSMETDVEIGFTSYSQYAEMISDIYEAVGNLEFALEYGENKKGYPTFKITDIFEA